MLYVVLSPLQITIPSADTTYWCAGFRTPAAIRSSVKHLIEVRLSVHTVELTILYVAANIPTRSPDIYCQLTIELHFTKCVQLLSAHDSCQLTLTRSLRLKILPTLTKSLLILLFVWVWMRTHITPPIYFCIHGYIIYWIVHLVHVMYSAYMCI